MSEHSAFDDPRDPSSEPTMSEDPKCPKCGGPTDHASGYVYRRANEMNNPPAQQEPVIFRVCRSYSCGHCFGLQVSAQRHPRLYQAEKEAGDGS